jgi:hypothetical protein
VSNSLNWRDLSAYSRFSWKDNNKMVGQTDKQDHHKTDRQTESLADQAIEPGQNNAFSSYLIKKVFG